SRKRERRFSLRHLSLTLRARRRNYEVDKARSSVTNGFYRRICTGLNVPRGTLGLAKLGNPNVPRGTLGITNLGKGVNGPLPNGVWRECGLHQTVKSAGAAQPTGS